MREHIVYPILDQSGTEKEIKIVPETTPGVNGRRSITGVFHFFHFISRKPAALPKEVDMDTYMSFAGSIRFINENFYEWRYDGQVLTETEIVQLVKLIQDHAEEWLSGLGELPALKEDDLNDPESSLYISDEQLKEMMENPLYSIAPYFVYGEDDDFIAIIQNSGGFDIHINGEIVALLYVFQDTGHKIANGNINDEALLNEIIRRVKAIREL